MKLDQGLCFLQDTASLQYAVRSVGRRGCFVCVGIPKKKEDGFHLQ